MARSYYYNDQKLNQYIQPRIKKYYNYKPKSERKKDVIEPKPEPKKEDPQPRLNYLGFNTGNIKNDTRQHMTNRIFNW